MKVLITYYVCVHPNDPEIAVLPLMKSIIVDRSKPIQSNEDLQKFNQFLKEHEQKSWKDTAISCVSITNIVPMNPINDYITKKDMEVLRA